MFSTSMRRQAKHLLAAFLCTPTRFSEKIGWGWGVGGVNVARRLVQLLKFLHHRIIRENRSYVHTDTFFIRIFVLLNEV